jgi:3-isopropylmalate/(R)-2-methylmalate dehydratase small subunit
VSQVIKGKVFVLGNDIDTDQIIPAKYLVYSLDDPEEQKKYGEFALSGVPLDVSGLPDGNIPFVESDDYYSKFSIIIAGKNFGCGSSREHAPAALQIAGVKAVVAPSYARIFYRNSVDGGFLTPIESLESLVDKFHTGDEVEINLEEENIKNNRTQQTYRIRNLGQVKNIIDAGGIFAYARETGMIGE